MVLSAWMCSCVSLRIGYLTGVIKTLDKDDLLHFILIAIGLL